MDFNEKGGLDSTDLPIESKEIDPILVKQAFELHAHSLRILERKLKGFVSINTSRQVAASIQLAASTYLRLSGTKYLRQKDVVFLRMAMAVTSVSDRSMHEIDLSCECRPGFVQSLRHLVCSLQSITSRGIAMIPKRRTYAKRKEITSVLENKIKTGE